MKISLSLSKATIHTRKKRRKPFIINRKHTHATLFDRIFFFIHHWNAAWNISACYFSICSFFDPEFLWCLKIYYIKWNGNRYFFFVLWCYFGSFIFRFSPLVCEELTMDIKRRRNRTTTKKMRRKRSKKERRELKEAVANDSSV